MKVLVIGDIHGELETFKEFIKDIDRSKTRIILVGDLIDRGPNSEGVIDFVRNNAIECVKGNHEAMAEECLPYLKEGNEWTLGGSDWVLNGGHDVIKQYSSKEKLINDIKWLSELPLFIKTGITNKNNLELLVSHTWVTGYADIEQASTSEMFVWNRKQPTKFANTAYYNIFGHTPTSYLHEGSVEEIPTPIQTETNINIDTGCTYKTKGRGYLTGVFFPSLKIKQLKRINNG